MSTQTHFTVSFHKQENGAFLFYDIYLNCLMERLVARVFYETAKRTVFRKYFFTALSRKFNNI